MADVGIGALHGAVLHVQHHQGPVYWELVVALYSSLLISYFRWWMASERSTPW